MAFCEYPFFRSGAQTCCDAAEALMFLRLKWLTLLSNVSRPSITGSMPLSLSSKHRAGREAEESDKRLAGQRRKIRPL